MKRIKHTVSITALLLALSVCGHSFAQAKIVVDKKGGGNFTSIQAAINSLTDSSNTSRLIFIKNGTYDEKIRLKEIMEKEIAETNVQQEGKLKELYNRIAFEQDNEFIREFFDEARNNRKEKMRARLQRWKESDHGSFDKMWESLKRDILTKQEN